MNVGLRLVAPLAQPSALAEFDGLPRVGEILALVNGEQREHVQVFSVHSWPGLPWS